MKKVKQAEENDRRQSAKDNLSRLEVSFFQQPFKVAFNNFNGIKVPKPVFSLYTFFYFGRYANTIFRPPKQLV